MSLLNHCSVLVGVVGVITALRASLMRVYSQTQPTSLNQKQTTKTKSDEEKFQRIPSKSTEQIKFPFVFAQVFRL